MATSPTGSRTRVGSSSDRGARTASVSCAGNEPRVGIFGLRATRKTRTRMSGTSSPAPLSGIHSNLFWRSTTSDWSIPIARPESAAGPMRVKRPITAAAIAGTTNSV